MIRQDEEKADLEAPENNPFKHKRLGYLSSDRPSDELLKVALEQLPGEGTLPKYWKYGTHDDYCEMYGHLGKVVWAKSYNHHLLILYGQRILRIWTDLSNHCWVDITEYLVPIVQQWFVVKPVPAGCYKKSKPFQYRIKVHSVEEMATLIAYVRDCYGF